MISVDSAEYVRQHVMGTGCCVKSSSCVRHVPEQNEV